MKVNVLVGALAVAAVSVVSAAAQTSGGTAAEQADVPTVTIINKAPEPLPTEAEEIPPALPERAPDAAEAEEPAEIGNDDADAAAAEFGDEALEAEAAEVAPEPPPEPTLAIDIDLTRQAMTVSDKGEVLYSWPISSARSGYHTPTGSYRPSWMAKIWHSRQYDYSPMPHAIFFHKGVAIHGSYATGMLGYPASHGCVRLAPRNAATLFKLVSKHGKDRTEIVVHGTPDHSSARIAGREQPRGTRRMRSASPYAYVPSGYAPRGYAYAPPPGAYYNKRTRRQPPPRYAPRGLYNSYSSGYGY